MLVVRLGEQTERGSRKYPIYSGDDLMTLGFCVNSFSIACDVIFAVLISATFSLVESFPPDVQSDYPPPT